MVANVKEVVERFKKFFVDVGPNLAKDISTMRGTSDEEEFEGRNLDSMVLDKTGKCNS